MAFVSAYSSQNWLVNITYGIGELSRSGSVSKQASVSGDTGDTVNISEEARELLAANTTEDGQAAADAIQESGAKESGAGISVSAQGIKVGGVKAGASSEIEDSSDTSDEIEELQDEIEELKTEIEELQAKASSDEEAKQELKAKRIELTALELELALLQQQQQQD